MKLNEAIRAAQKIKSDCDFLMEQTGFDGYTFDKIETKNLSADERFLFDRLVKALDGLDIFVGAIDYISRPIKFEGTLRKNERGRHECEAREYTSGCTIEYQTYDDFDERDEWQLSRVEHNGNDYYIVADRDLSLDGLRVRVR